MEADYSVELAADDPALEFPWSDPEGRCAYVDLKANPERVNEIPEAVAYSELAQFLVAMNSQTSIFETAKCDVWMSDEIEEVEKIFGATHKTCSYVDLVLRNSVESQRMADTGNLEDALELRQDFEFHENLARGFAKLLSATPDIPASAELIVRRCYFSDVVGDDSGFYFTLYASGYGDSPEESRQRWGAALELLKNGLLQMGSTRP